MFQLLSGATLLVFFATVACRMLTLHRLGGALLALVTFAAILQFLMPPGVISTLIALILITFIAISWEHAYPASSSQ